MSDYKRNPRSARRARKSLSRKALVVLSLMMVLAVAAVGGTIAWLTVETDPVTNTFTTSDINITLTESKTDFKMVPGYTIEKDPTVTVKGGSEKCYLFVKVDESANLDDFITYTIADGWTQLKDADNNDVNGVFYRVVAASATDTTFSVLKDDQVTVNQTVTKAMMNSITDTTKPTLTFTAYATQYMKSNTENFTAAEAWANAQPAASGT